MVGKAVLDFRGHPGVGCVAAAPALVSPSSWGQVVAEIWGSPGVEFGAGGVPAWLRLSAADRAGVGGSAVTAEGGSGVSRCPHAFHPPHPLVSVEQPLSGSILLPQHIPAISAAASRSSRPPLSLPRGRALAPSHRSATSVSLPRCCQPRVPRRIPESLIQDTFPSPESQPSSHPPRPKILGWGVPEVWEAQGHIQGRGEEILRGTPVERQHRGLGAPAALMRGVGRLLVGCGRNGKIQRLGRAPLEPGL